MEDNKKPNIAFLLGSTSSNGGIERVTSIIAHHLIEEKIAHIHAIGFHPRATKRYYEWNQSVSFFDLLSEKKTMKSGILEARKRLRQYLRENNIDILISCGHIYCLLGFLSTFGLKTKFIYWSHSSLFGAEKNNFKKVNEHIGALFSNTLITLTKTDEKNYRKNTFAKNVVQIYNPIDEKLLDEKIEYRKTSKKIISVGRLTYQKQFHTNLIDVANRVLKANPEFTWHIYGKGELEAEIIERIKFLGLEDRIILEGNVNNLYELYREYAMMVMTSAYEGFPMTLLEGMACKLPLISFDIPTGPNEIIVNGKNGFLIPAFDCDEMAKKTEILILDENLRTNFSETQSSMINEFQMNPIINKWKELINNLTN
ncbi:glycosyltransferase family 4 protein [Maribacter sp. 2210JD10-5]|uniref:glycosyltransferase family 4 protein n=1 Tax=Maribacter sp. 2210JD10-5 TaxID=3386272 RepID=UPI0039BC7D7D